MLIRFTGGADLRIKVVHTGHVHLFEIPEDVALAACRHAEVLLEEEVPRENQAVFFAPVAQLAVVGLGVLLGESPPEVVADLCRETFHLHVERGEIGLEVVAPALAEDLEHLLRPRDHVVKKTHVVVVHGGLVGEEARHGPAKLVANRLFVPFVRQLDKFLRRLRIERINVEGRPFLEEVEQHPLAGGGLPGDRFLPRQVFPEVHQVSDPLLVLVTADGVGRHRPGVAGVDVTIVVCFEEGEDGSVEVQRDELEVSLAQLGIGFHHLIVGGAARPVVLIVNPGVDANLPGFGDGKADPFEPRFGKVGYAETHTGVYKEAPHATVVVLTQLPLHFVGFHVSVPEPERHDPHLERRNTEVLPGKLDPAENPVLKSH